MSFKFQTELPLRPLQEALQLHDSGCWGDEATPADGAPVLRSTNINDGTLSVDAPAWRLLSLRDRKNKKLNHGDILVTKSSGSADHIGKCAMFVDGGEQTSYYFSNFTLRLRAKADRADSRYIFYWLNSSPGKAALRALSTTTTGLRNLDTHRYLNQLVPLPPVDEQRRIAVILDKADAIRRKRRQALAEIDALLRSTYAHVLGHLNPELAAWPLRSIEELASPCCGSMRTGPFGSDLRHSEFVDEGVAVLGIDNAVNNAFEWAERRYITEDKYERLRRYRVYPGDVIVTIMGTTGRSAVAPDDIPEAITTKHLATITPDKKQILPEVLSFAIHSDPLVIHQIRRANKGAIMSGLNLGIIKSLELRSAPLRLQERFVYIYKQSLAIQSQLSDPQISGEALFTSLSQRAFRGEL